MTDNQTIEALVSMLQTMQEQYSQSVEKCNIQVKKKKQFVRRVHELEAEKLCLLAKIEELKNSKEVHKSQSSLDKTIQSEEVGIQLQLDNLICTYSNLNEVANKAMEHLQNFINECDYQTEQAKKRLAETQEELNAEVTAKLNRVHELAEQISQKLAQAEKLGAKGNVEEAVKTMEEADEFRRQKLIAEQDYKNSMSASSYQQQKLRECEVCSAYLGIHDNDRRLADHFGGELHLGFIAIREKLEELKTIVNEKRQKGRLERDRENYRDTEKRGAREWTRSWGDRSRSKSPVRRRWSRSTSKNHTIRHRSRSRSAEKRRYSRHQRSDSRERDRRTRDDRRSYRMDCSNERYNRDRRRFESFER